MVMYGTLFLEEKVHPTKPKKNVQAVNLKQNGKLQKLTTLNYEWTTKNKLNALF